MTKLKHIAPYLFLVLLSFFISSLVWWFLWDWNIYSFGFEKDPYLYILIFGAIIYVVYAIINSILKKVLPPQKYKDGRFAKLLTFFLIFTIGWISFPIIMMFLLSAPYYFS